MKSLSTLLGESWTFCLVHGRALLIAALLFGGFTGVVQARTVVLLRDAYQDLMHVSPERLKAFAERIELGDELAMSELLREMSGIDGTVPVNQEQAILALNQRFASLTLNMLPYLFWAFVAITVIQLLLYASSFAIAVGKEKHFSSALRHAFSVFVPFLGLFLWVTVRSFLWFPILGLVYATYYLPRALFSPVYVIRGSSIGESVNRSFAITTGRWSLVTWYVSACTLLSMVFGMVLTGVLQGIGVLPSFLSAVFGALIMSYNIVFIVLLGEELEASK